MRDEHSTNHVGASKQRSSWASGSTPRRCGGGLLQARQVIVLGDGAASRLQVYFGTFVVLRRALHSSIQSLELYCVSYNRAIRCIGQLDIPGIVDHSKSFPFARIVIEVHRYGL